MSPQEHSGNCLKLISALKELMPKQYGNVNKIHISGSSDECFRTMIKNLVSDASNECHLAMSYAMVCEEISEVFDRASGDSSTVTNPFKYLVANQCKLSLTTFRNDPKAYTSQEDLFRIQGALKYDFNKAEQQKQLQLDLDTKTKSRQLATGITKFIAELFNVGFMNSRVMELCMEELLQTEENPTELSIECFYILITSIGEKFEINKRGVAVVDKHLQLLEQIIDKRSEEFCMKIRYMILEIFELRATAWKSSKTKEVVAQPIVKPKEKIQTGLSEASKATQVFLHEWNDVLCQLDSDKLLDFMDRFLDIKFKSEEQLKGATKIIFERAVAKPEQTLYAIVCKGLVDVTFSKCDGDGDRNMTFKVFLLALCHQEIEVHRKNVSNFREFGERLEALKHENDPVKFQRLKAELNMCLQLQKRSFNFTKFLSELFNVDFLESRFIFDYLTVLLLPAVISNTSIECFCLTLTTVGAKMISEKNRNILLKSVLSKLEEASKSVELSQKVRFLVKDIFTFGRIQLNLKIDHNFADEFGMFRQFELPWRTNFSKECLWESSVNPKTSSDKYHEGAEPHVSLPT